MRLAGERHAETFLRDAGSGRLSVGPENHHFRFGAPRHGAHADDCAADGGEGHVRNAEIRPRLRPGVLREFRQFRLGRQHHGRPGVDGICPDGRSRHPRYGNRTRRLCGLLREGRLQQPRLGVHPVEHVGRDQRQNGRHIPPDVRFVRREPQYRRLYLYVPLPGIPGLSGLRHR